MEREGRFIAMASNMKVNLSKVRKMGKGNLNGAMANYMKGNLRRIVWMAMVQCIIKIGRYI